MRTLILFLVFGMCAFATEPEASKSKAFVDSVMLYDGQHESVPFPWIRRMITAGHWVQCGHLEVSSSVSRYGDAGDKKLDPFRCRYSVLGIDFSRKALLAFVDLHKYDQTPGGLSGGYPVLRYLVSITGKPKDYFAPFEASEAGGKQSSLQSLAQVMTTLSRTKKRLGQSRFLDGQLTVTYRGEPMTDPTYHGLEGMEERRLHYGYEGWGPSTYELKGDAGQNKFYPVPTEVYDALSKTMDILWEGYEDLKAASGDSAKEAFKEKIATNADTLSSELKNAVELMRSKRYHPLELLWFVNQMGDVIAAIDRILESKEGGNPGYVELINGRRR